MRICENGIYRDATEEEIAQMESAQEEVYTASKSADMTESEKLSLLVSSLTEDKTNKGDNGEVKTKAVLDGNTIVYVDSGERMGTGTYEDPMQFVDGDSVTAGLYYCRCKVDAKGSYYRQLTSGTYKAYATKDNPTWGKMTDFEFAY